MSIAKRIFFFVMVNLLVITTITISLSLIQMFFGINLFAYTGLGGLFIFCLVWGMGGAFVSLALSRWMAKMMMRVQVIDPSTNDSRARELVQTVHRLAKRAGIQKMPEVGVYDSPEVNAFATGPTKNKALVAVSSGLLQRMDGNQVEGVLGHEVAHIANGDMVTMTLLQGIINALVMFLARIIAGIVSSQVDERARWGVHFALVILLQIALSFLGMIVVAFFSRWREFRADHGGAQLAGKDKMVAALEGLKNYTELVAKEDNAISTLKISGSRTGALAKLFSTHPPLPERIERLQRAR